MTRRIARLQLPRVSPTMAQIIVDALNFLAAHVDEAYDEQNRANASRDIRTLWNVLAMQLDYFDRGITATMKPVDSPDDLEDPATAPDAPLRAGGIVPEMES